MAHKRANGAIQVGRNNGGGWDLLPLTARLLKLKGYMSKDIASMLDENGNYISEIIRHDCFEFPDGVISLTPLDEVADAQGAQQEERKIVRLLLEKLNTIEEAIYYQSGMNAVKELRGGRSKNAGKRLESAERVAREQVDQAVVALCAPWEDREIPYRRKYLPQKTKPIRKFQSGVIPKRDAIGAIIMLLHADLPRNEIANVLSVEEEIVAIVDWVVQYIGRLGDRVTGATQTVARRIRRQEQAIEMFRDGKSSLEIADVLDLHVTTVRGYLRGIKPPEETTEEETETEEEVYVEVAESNADVSASQLTDAMATARVCMLKDMGYTVKETARHQRMRVKEVRELLTVSNRSYYGL